MSTCKVVDERCTAPAGYLVQGMGYGDGESQRLPTCYTCGEHVCLSCSTKVGRSRICFDCQEQNVKHRHPEGAQS